MLKTYFTGMSSLSGLGDPVLIVLSLFETTFTLKRKEKIASTGVRVGMRARGRGMGVEHILFF